MLSASLGPNVSPESGGSADQRFARQARSGPLYPANVSNGRHASSWGDANLTIEVQTIVLCGASLSCQEQPVSPRDLDPIGDEILADLESFRNVRNAGSLVDHLEEGSVAESMGRIVGETPLLVEEAESGTVPRGMPAPASVTPSPNPWDLSLSRQNVCSTLKELERRIGLRRDATRAPIQGPEWQGAGFHSRPQNSN